MVLVGKAGCGAGRGGSDCEGDWRGAQRREEVVCAQVNGVTAKSESQAGSELLPGPWALLIFLMNTGAELTVVSCESLTWP